MLNLSFVTEDVRRALEEDLGSGDVTAALLPASQHVSAIILSREPMLVCGVPWVNQAFSSIDASITLDWQVSDGDYLAEPSVLATLQGPVQGLLTAERVALNFLQTLSGTATETYCYVRCLEDTEAKLLDTRKTLPGLRHAQKYAVTCGGGVNHRMGLYDAVLIKENHIKACGSIKQAVIEARLQGLGDWIEVEVETLDEFQEAREAAPDRILLDNFTEAMLLQAVTINQTKPVILEASGGVTLSNLHAIAQTGVDYISVGAITKSVRAIDLSLLLDDEAP